MDFLSYRGQPLKDQILSNKYQTKIGIDARFCTQLPRRGIGNYSVHLVNSLVRQFPDFEFYLYISQPDTDNILPNTENVNIVHLKPSLYPVWESIALPLALLRDDINLLHCLANTAPFYLPKHIKLVLSVMDVMYLINDKNIPTPTNLYQQIGRIYRQLNVPIVAKRADAIITISEYSKNDIIGQINGIDRDRLYVTYLSCDDVYKNRISNVPSFKIPEKFILALGARDPRKNTYNLILSYLDLCERTPDLPNLLVVGYENWGSSNCADHISSHPFGYKIISMPYVSKEDLAILYTKAEFFIYPTLYEGFGIPILEAFSCHCAVLASNLSCLPEIVSDAAYLFDPTNNEKISEAINFAFRNPHLMNKLRGKGADRAKQFNWELAAKKTGEIYSQFVHCLDS
jgi:glycosyltransferase involved in cell wall biosynthesis